jgi:hypothetical protein
MIALALKRRSIAHKWPGASLCFTAALRGGPVRQDSPGDAPRALAGAAKQPILNRYRLRWDAWVTIYRARTGTRSKRSTVKATIPGSPTRFDVRATRYFVQNSSVSLSRVLSILF